MSIPAQICMPKCVLGCGCLRHAPQTRFVLEFVSLPDLDRPGRVASLFDKSCQFLPLLAFGECRLAGLIPGRVCAGDTCHSAGARHLHLCGGSGDYRWAWARSRTKVGSMATRGPSVPVL